MLSFILGLVIGGTIGAIGMGLLIGGDTDEKYAKKTSDIMK